MIRSIKTLFSLKRHIERVDVAVPQLNLNQSNYSHERPFSPIFENDHYHMNNEENMEVEQDFISYDSCSEYSSCSNLYLSTQSDADSDSDTESTTSIEDNVDETDCNVDPFIYSDANLKLSQFNLLLSLFISRYSLSKKCSKELLKLLSFLLPTPNKISKTVEKLYANHNSNKPIKKFVCSCCWNAKESIDSCCENVLCAYYQGASVSLKENGLEVLYLDTSQQLESILKRERLTIIKYKTVN